MALRRMEGGGPDSDRRTLPHRDPAAELEAVLDELEVRFLLDPDTRFDTTFDSDATAQQ